MVLQDESTLHRVEYVLRFVVRQIKRLAFLQKPRCFDFLVALKPNAIRGGLGAYQYPN